MNKWMNDGRGGNCGYHICFHGVENMSDRIYRVATFGRTSVSCDNFAASTQRTNQLFKQQIHGRPKITPDKLVTFLKMKAQHGQIRTNQSHSERTSFFYYQYFF